MVKQFRMREILLATVCTVGISGVAQAQFSGSLSLESIYEKGNGGFGANAGLLLPLFSSPTGMFYTMVEGGWRDGFDDNGHPAGSFGMGYRWLPAGFDGVGIGLNGSFDIQRTRNHNNFYGTTAGLEIFIPGGLSISMNGYIPLFDKDKKVTGSSSSSSTAPTLELRDQAPGSCDPTNPLRVCVPVLAGSSGANSSVTTERNRWGADVHIAYRLPFFELIDITPNVSMYMMDRQGKQLKGITGGMDVALPLAGGMQVTMSAQGRHDREIGTVAEFGLGLRINLGPSAVTSDPRQRLLAQAPRRMGVQDRQPEIRVEASNTVASIEEAVKWDKTDAVVTEMRFIDAANQDQAVAQAAALADGGILWVNGNVALAAGETIVVTGLNKGVLGGGSTINLQGVDSATVVTYTAPGTRGKITQDNLVTRTFAIDGGNKIFVRSLDIQGKGQGIVVVDSSQQVTLEDMQVTGIISGGAIRLLNSQQLILKQIKIDSEASVGLLLVNADNALVEDLQIDIRQPNAIAVGVAFGSDLVTFKTLRLDGHNQPASVAFLSETNSNGQIFIQDIQMQNFEFGLRMDGETLINDLTHDHQATNVMQVCDFTPDAVGVVDVLNNNTTIIENCQ